MRSAEGGAGCFVDGGKGVRSLGTVRVAALRGVTFAARPRLGKWDYRLAFVDRDDQAFDLPVTDLAFRYFLDMVRDQDGLSPVHISRNVCDRLCEADALYLRIGLARGFGPTPDRCHLQINGVYSFPDYLDGCCFADLVPPRPDLDLSDVPF